MKINVNYICVNSFNRECNHHRFWKVTFLCPVQRIRFLSQQKSNLKLPPYFWMFYLFTKHSSNQNGPKPGGAEFDESERFGRTPISTILFFVGISLKNASAPCPAAEKHCNCSAKTVVLSRVRHLHNQVVDNRGLHWWSFHVPVETIPLVFRQTQSKEFPWRELEFGLLLPDKPLCSSFSVVMQNLFVITCNDCAAGNGGSNSETVGGRSSWRWEQVRVSECVLACLHRVEMCMCKCVCV